MALDIVKKDGVSALTARELGKRLGSSSCPVFTVFKNMAVTAVIFLVVYTVLEKSFVKIATVNKITGKAKYKGKKLKRSSVDSALLKKELRRFLGSPTYMLNCGLGLVIITIAAIVLLIKSNDAVYMMSEIFGANKEILPLIITAAVCMISSMNDISAPSVSLEGKNLWLLQVLPVSLVIAFVCLILYRWIRNKGTKIFETL